MINIKVLAHFFILFNRVIKNMHNLMCVGTIRTMEKFIIKRM